MARRYAILEDNQRALEGRLDVLREQLPPLVGARIAAIRLIGSVAKGEARDASDIDLVLVLREGSPRRADYRWWDETVAPGLVEDGGFPVQPIFVARTALTTREPNLRRALREGITLWDPEGLFGDESDTRA